jgi:hypothetical protein
MPHRLAVRRRIAFFAVAGKATPSRTATFLRMKKVSEMRTDPGREFFRFCPDPGPVQFHV